MTFPLLPKLHTSVLVIDMWLTVFSGNKKIPVIIR